MLRTTIFENPRSLRHVCDKMHLLVTQHLSGTDTLNLLAVSPGIHRMMTGCDACINKVFVKIDFVDAASYDDLRNILRSNRKYTKFRFMCYDSLECVRLCFRILEAMNENMDTIEVFDMTIDESIEDIMMNFPKLKNLKVSSFKGNYQNIFLQPGVRYQSFAFENLLEPVDIKAIGEFKTAARTLSIKNCTLKNVESFTFFDDYCNDVILEYNKRSDWSDLCAILRKSNDLQEFVITKKNSAGYRLMIHREFIETTRSRDAKILARRAEAAAKKEAEAAAKAKEEANESTSPQLEADVEMKVPRKLERINENRAELFTRRRSVSKIFNEDSDDASSICSRISVSSEAPDPNKPIFIFKAVLEVDELSLPMIKKFAKAYPFLTTLKIFDVHLTVIGQLFEFFNWLEKVITVNGDFESEFTRNMFENDCSMDPIKKLPAETFDLIFQHLDMDELLIASTVSKVWNQVLGETEAFTNRVVLKVKPSEFRNGYDKVCKSSQRNYKFVDISCQKSNEFSISGLEIAHVFSLSLVELSLSYFHLEKISSLKDRFVFSQLKSLKLHHVDVNSCSVLLQNCNILQSLFLSSMPFTESIIDRLDYNDSLKELSLNDCTFEYFATYKIQTVKNEEKFEKIDLNLKSFAISFDRANSWRVQQTLGFKNFLKVFSLYSVESLEISGIRGEFIVDFMKHIKSIKKLKIKHIWKYDLNDRNVFRIRDYFELEASTFGIGSNIKWINKFPSTSQVSIKRQKFMDLSENDEKLKKTLKLTADKMIRKRIFVPERIPIGYYDPMVRVSENSHELIFQHLTGHDILNAFEVSRTWNNFCKKSDHCAKKFNLYIKASFKEHDRKVLEKSSRRFMNVISDYYQPTMVRCFSNLRRLSLAFYVPGKFQVSEPFPFLETLIIQKCPTKFYTPENVLKCFEVFAQCTTLTYLEIYEAVTCENYSAIWDMLANNVTLKKLKIHQCSEFFHLFCKDISHRIRFQLDQLDYRIPQKFSLVGSEFEQNCAKFLATQKSVKIIDMNLCSAVMLNEIFKLPKLETLRLLRITGYDHVMLEPCLSLKEFVFPDTPQIFLRSDEKFNFAPFFEAIHNIERLYVYSLSEEMLQYAVRNYKNLTHLACDRFTGNDIDRCYKTLKYKERNSINLNVVMKRTKFNLIDTDERSFERIFNEPKYR